MLAYIGKLIVLVLFSFLIISFYYLPGLNHIESFGNYSPYIITIAILYLIYKGIQLYIDKPKVQFSPASITGYFLIHLLVLSVLFYYFNWIEYDKILKGSYVDLGIKMFFDILAYSILPATIVFISLAFGKKIIKIAGLYKDNSSEKVFHFIVSLGIGFFSFLSSIVILGILGFYNIWSVIIVLAILFALSFNEVLYLFKGFFSYKIEFDRHDLRSNSFLKKISLNLLSTEFLFIVASFLIAVNFINIMRPMPIGWDDLGVYMNYPRQLAYAGEIFALGGMYAWQVFTGIGFMVGEPNQAFFLNNVGGVLSFVLIILVVGDLLKTKSSTYINIPLLLATIFISMPMVIFQQAKDMKLDQGLFFVSIIAIYIIYKLFFTDLYIKKSAFGLLFKKIVGKEKDAQINLFEKDRSKTIKLIIIAGLLVGFAFSIKFTSLLLLSALIGVISYVGFGTFGFLGFLFIFFAVFTKFGLWSYMNVVYPSGDASLINNFSLISFVVGSLLIFVGFYKYSTKTVNSFFKILAVFLISVVIGLSPWLLKNIGEIESVSLGGLLHGKVERINIDYTKIYTEQELEDINNKLISGRGLTESGTTINEDYGRYFGYEKGINNYVKLPWNLTMQLNQGGEFTTIGFLFLALIPGLFLFLPYRKGYLSLVVIGLLVLELFLFVLPSSKEYFTNLFSTINLPYGYLVLFFIFFIPAVFFLVSLKNTKITTLFRVNLVFLFFYMFLWSISAFGIVWYGIMMYFSLLLAIAIGLYYISSYKNEESKRILIVKFVGSLVGFSIFLVWIFYSVFPHGFNNLKSAGYPYYKSGQLSAEELVFGYHSDYIKILLYLNIDKDKRQEFINDSFKDETLKKLLEPVDDDIYTLVQYLKMIGSGLIDKAFPPQVLSQLDNSMKEKLKLSAVETKEAIFRGIMKPDDKYKNDIGIYRVGTFLKYYINENHKRLYEDSLLNSFDRYIYDDDINKSVARMKSLGLGFLLVDLNAATIDKDPRHDLTRRYENLLKTFTSNELELVETDSICLKLAIDIYKEKKDLNDYMKIAGVNFESYTNDGKVIKRGEKQLYCFRRIIDVINENKLINKEYYYLKDIRDHLLKNNANMTQEDVTKYLASKVRRGARVLFEIK